MTENENDAITLNDKTLAAIARTVSQQLISIPREIREVIQPGRQYVFQLNPLLKTPANYLIMRVSSVDDGLWITFELNSYRIWEFKFIYSMKYLYPMDSNRHTFQPFEHNHNKCKVCRRAESVHFNV